MKKQLKNNFIQAFGGTLIWILVIATIFSGNAMVRITYFWNLVGIAALGALLFGVLYTYLWNYSTFKATGKITASVLANAIFMSLGVWLFSPQMFTLLFPFALPILGLTLVLHIIAFYFYTASENRKDAAELNNMMNK